MEDFRELWDRMTDRERRFITAYATLDFAPRKASAALRAAGLDANLHSGEAERVAAHRLLTSDNVRLGVALLSQAALLSPEQILARRAAIATADIGDILDTNGKIDLGKAVREGLTWMIRSVKYRPTRAGLEVSVEIHDPQPALRALEIAAGLDRQRVEVETGDRLSAILQARLAPWADGWVDDNGEEDSLPAAHPPAARAPRPGVMRLSDGESVQTGE